MRKFIDKKVHINLAPLPKLSSIVVYGIRLYLMTSAKVTIKVDMYSKKTNATP